DQGGGNGELDGRLDVDSGCRRKNTKGQLNIYSRDALAPKRICGPLPVGVRPDSYSIRPFKISQWVKDGDRIDLGDRQLEVISTPGHTPDSLCLLDRKNGLLFTGDTFYLGPIYLITPETTQEVYANSDQRIVVLVPKLKLLLPGHNTPVAAPENLLRLASAIRDVQSGNLKPTLADGRRQYPFRGFSLLLPAN